MTPRRTFLTLSLALALPALPPPARADEAFRRGEFNRDGSIDIADPVGILFHLFAGVAPGGCADAGDVNDDGQLDLTDAIDALGFLFLGGPAPSPPFPACGADPTPDALACHAISPCPQEPVENKIVSIRSVGAGIEIQLYSSMPFPARALRAVLCIGERGFWHSRHAAGGDQNTIIFTLTAEEFAETRTGDPVAVEHEGCERSHEDQVPYWDLWEFGPLDKGLLDR